MTVGPAFGAGSAVTGEVSVVRESDSDKIFLAAINPLQRCLHDPRLDVTAVSAVGEPPIAVLIPSVDNMA